jgi:hypothetical protein
MRLLHTQTLTLHKFPPDRIPLYAILSHTWGKDEEEVKLQDLETPGVARKAGYAKIEGCCRQAREDKLEYVWVDTCCIDKTSSAELSEAINSMFRWYKNAKVCYVYLADVPSSSDPKDLVSFKSSRWFTRGWTLQELIAPGNIVFYTKEWTKLGTKIELSLTISAVTSIRCDILFHKKALEDVSIADRMSWVSRRFTTQPEDIAYCVLGIFDVNMPLLYGEGQKAFIRLQEEIIKVSDDHSIFAWTRVPGSLNRSMLALSPHMFGNIGSIVRYREDVSNKPFTMTNNGLQIELPILRAKNRLESDLAVLNCRSADEKSPLAIRLKPLWGNFRYVRGGSEDPVTLPLWKVAKAVRQVIHVDPPHRGLALLLPRKHHPSLVVFRTLPAEENFRLIDFYPHDLWRKNDRAFVLPWVLSTLGYHRFGLLFKDQSGACFAVLGGTEGLDEKAWVGLLQDPSDFITIIRKHENTSTTRAMMIWKDGENSVEIVAELEVVLAGYDRMIIIDVEISG